LKPLSTLVIARQPRGPGKGGTRYPPAVDLYEVRALVHMRTAAYILGMGWVARAITLRGLFP
jgi:glutamate dehydrogenase/leucine dehydrogenase